MKTNEINQLLSRGVTRNFYRGAFPEDIDFHFKPPYCVVTNCDSHNEPGSHWNAWFVTKSQVFFFDSYGRGPRDLSLPRAYSLFVKNKKVKYNHKIVEGIFAKSCGEFCIFVLKRLCKGDKWTSIINSFVEIPSINEQKVKKFVQKLKK